MLTAISEQFPRLCAAMRRAYGLAPDQSAALLMLARYGPRANVWSPYNARQARDMIGEAIACRYRPRAA